MLITRATRPPRSPAIEAHATGPKKQESRNTLKLARVGNGKVVAGGVRKRRESSLTEPVQLSLEGLYLPRLRACKVDKASSRGDPLHSPGSLLVKQV